MRRLAGQGALVRECPRPENVRFFLHGPQVSPQICGKRGATLEKMAELH
jgi:hypothetical protein